MDTIRRMIAEGYSKEALEWISENTISSSDRNLCFNLMGQLASLTKRHNMGTIANQDYTIGINRINVAALHLIDSGIFTSAPAPLEIPANKCDFSETALLKIIKQYQRKLPNVSEIAQQLLTKLQDYNNQKRIKSTFDPAGRKMRGMKATFKTLVSTIDDLSDDKTEQFAERIEQLLSANFPSWQNISTAYGLCLGKNFRNTQIERCIDVQPDDDDAKADCADAITEFVGNL